MANWTATWTKSLRLFKHSCNYMRLEKILFTKLLSWTILEVTNKLLRLFKCIGWEWRKLGNETPKAYLVIQDSYITAS